MTPQASPNRTTLTWLIPITLLIAVCAMVGGLIARQVYAVTKPPSVSHAPVTSESSAPPAVRPPDPRSVYFLPFAQNDPLFSRVQNAIQSYFNATNDQDYNLWRKTMTPKVAQQQTQQDWLGGLRSTKDSDMTVYRIEATDKGADVFGSFTSKQDLADAPDTLKATCINWWMVWPMEDMGSGSFRIGSPSVIAKKCEG
ncbi:hypothetical protein [Kutzneria sp. CA-103260]|uniref:hypothetical protein n=1 Tax=Kutzneria sp. CA-103260 TaxID=2802641 RepID=UPI001BA61949|nr:hypothetical protein [Kutzneria sp. CA-103260]